MPASAAGARLLPLGVLLVLFLWSRSAPAQLQNLGHKALGSEGVNAGVQPPPGLYVANSLLAYAANSVNDRNGNRVPGTILISVIAERAGLGACLFLEPIATYVGFALGVPLDGITAELEAEDVRASIDDFGLSDVYVQPVRLGWRLPHLDVVSGFGVYIPTGRFELGGFTNLGSGQWSRELTLGGTVYFDDDRVWRLSVLSSFVSNLPKLGVDIRRGNSVQVQGGASATMASVVRVGVAGYALWQVSEDSGANLPPIVAAGSDRVFGAGPEVDFVLPAIRSTVTLRYERDIHVVSGPLGQVFAFGVIFDAWTP